MPLVTGGGITIPIEGDPAGIIAASNETIKALDKVKDLTGDSATDQAETIDDSTAEAEDSEASEEQVTPSGAADDDVNKAAAVESIKRMIGG